MDAADIRMYFPVMKDHDFPATIIPMSGPRTPLGNAEFGGRLQGTTGTGFAQFRVYGMYALVLLLRGGGRYRDRRGVDRRLAAGDLLVVFPEHPHQYGPENGDEWDEVFLAFGGAAFEGWRANGLDPVNPVWPLPKTACWALRFFDILRMPHNSLAESTAVAAAIHQLIADALASPQTIRFEDACRIALALGFVHQGGQGSHRVFKRGGEAVQLNFQNRDGYIPTYQGRQLVSMIRKYGADL